MKTPQQIAEEAWSKLPGRPNLLYREKGIKIILSAIEEATKDMIHNDFVAAKLLELKTSKPHHVELKSQEVEKLWLSGEAVMQSRAAHASEQDDDARHRNSKGKLVCFDPLCTFDHSKT